MTTYISNAISLGMLDDVQDSGYASLSISRLTVEEAARELRAFPWVSIVGHADTALLFSTMLGIEIPMRRVTTSLRYGDGVIVGQYTGPRLPEGATELPADAKIRWIRVKVCSSRPLAECDQWELRAELDPK